MTTATAPDQTPRVRPLWERHQLFREPVYTDGQPYERDDEDEQPDRIITP